jgi:hypothetical protein
MQRLSLGWWCVPVLACTTLASTANAQTTKLSLHDFLAVQGQTSIYIPPAPDYLGWGQALCTSGGLRCTSPPYTGLCIGDVASVDYAGVVDKFIVREGGQSSNTDVDGSVIERMLADGRVEVTVALHTRNAFAFAVAPPPSKVIPGTSCVWPSDVDWVNGPLLLGARANTQTPPPLAKRALGESFFFVVYQAAKDKPLLDLLDLFNNHYADIEEYSFLAVADGPTPTGGHGRVTIVQAGKASRENVEPAIVNFRETRR